MRWAIGELMWLGESLAGRTRGWVVGIGVLVAIALLGASLLFQNRWVRVLAVVGVVGVAVSIVLMMYG